MSIKSAKSSALLLTEDDTPNMVDILCVIFSDKRSTTFDTYEHLLQHLLTYFLLG